MSNARRLLDDLARQLAAQEEATRPIPEPTPPLGHRRLCIGMATFDDFDGVWFTVQAIRMYHPEVVDDVSFIILDNHPEGPAASDLKSLESRVPGLRYVPFRGYRSTAARDLIFREADSDVVCCVDSHVLIEPGGLAALLGFFDQHPDSRDLVQGPLFTDDLAHIVGSHFEEVWSGGMYGRWAHDPRAEDRDGPAFEIPMQGLGLFACRLEAWPGINPRFRGFGGEEGYLHEKFRRRGGQVLCLPAVRWAHRFARPLGPPYRPAWEDRVRNYRFGWAEVGWDVAPMEAHFQETLGGHEQAEPILEQTARQVANPLSFFDAIFCLNLDAAPERWAAAQHRFNVLDIGWRVERFSAVATPGDHHRGCVASWRRMIAAADKRAYETVLVFEDDAIFHTDTLKVMRAATTDLAGEDWDLCYLGACVHAQHFPFLEGSRVLQECGPVTCTHALAVHRRAYQRILADIPPGRDELDGWLGQWLAIDQYLSRRIADGTFRALITSPRVATQPGLRNNQDAGAALADCYVI